MVSNARNAGVLILLVAVALLSAPAVSHAGEKQGTEAY